MLGGMAGDVIAGGVIGAGLAFARPTINKMVPTVGPLRPTTITLLGAGAGLKLVKKGGKFADAALIMGSAFAAHDLMASTGITSSSVTNGSTSSAGVPFG